MLLHLCKQWTWGCHLTRIFLWSFLQWLRVVVQGERVREQQTGVHRWRDDRYSGAPRRRGHGGHGGARQTLHCNIRRSVLQRLSGKNSRWLFAKPKKEAVGGWRKKNGVGLCSNSAMMCLKFMFHNLTGRSSQGRGKSRKKCQWIFFWTLLCSGHFQSCKVLIGSFFVVVFFQWEKQGNHRRRWNVPLREALPPNLRNPRSLRPKKFRSVCASLSFQRQRYFL